jgi:lysophospholipase L1-like esterase
MSVSYTLISDANGSFVLSGKQIKLAKVLAAGTSQVTIRATDDNGWSKDFVIDIPVLTALQALSLSKATFAANLAAGQVIGAIGNRAPGSTLSITPNDGRLAIDVSGNLVVGLSASSVGSFNVTLRESLGGRTRDTVVLITVTAPVTKTIGIIANRFQVPTATVSLPANYTSRRSHFASPDGAVSNFKTIDCGFVVAGNQPQAASARTIKRFIEYPAGVFTQVTWGGATQIALGSTVVVSDPINLTIPAGAEFWERTVNLVASSTYPCQQLPASSQALGVTDGNAASDLGNSGTIAATSTVTTFGATAMVGDIAAIGARSFVITGDSIAFGEGDITGVGAKRGSGWIARALDVYGYPYVKITKPGQMASEFVTALSLVTPFIQALQFSDVISEHGINDLRLSRTQAQVLADHQTIYGLFPGKNIYQTTLTPRSSSTDAYATTANQLGKTDGNMVALVPINGVIRAKPANVHKVIDAADAAMTARDSLIWPAPPVPTGDGTHPNSYMANVMAQALVGQFAA